MECNKTELNAIERAKRDLIHEQSNRDQEGAHGEADNILCNLLHALGLSEVVSEFEKIDKWYA